MRSILLRHRQREKSCHFREFLTDFGYEASLQELNEGNVHEDFVEVELSLVGVAC